MQADQGALALRQKLSDATDKLVLANQKLAESNANEEALKRKIAEGAR